MASTKVSYCENNWITDYYEFFEISPYATADTIHRVYRTWAARYHPDNPTTGDEEIFHTVRRAYDVLSNPELRAKYDAMRGEGAVKYMAPLSSIVDFMDGTEGEINRRLALMAMLYSRRRSNPRRPEVSLVEVEACMGFPREYLDFTTWYLAQKGYIVRADNSDFTITVAGVDYVEAERTNRPIVNRLLTSGRLHFSEPPVERRVNREDRRMCLPDARPAKIERRRNGGSRRVNKSDVRKETFSAPEIN
jgi:hypothetical protein